MNDTTDITIYISQRDIATIKQELDKFDVNKFFSNSSLDFAFSREPPYISLY